jgi:hypothetical protein
MAEGHGDAFEATAMHDGAPIVHRDKRVSRGMALLLAVPGLFTIALSVFLAIANGTSDKPIPAGALPFVVAGLAGLGVAFFVLGIVFGVLRTVVTERAVHVKYGLWGPDIPLESIESCDVVEYDWTEFGGWGIRLGADGTWAYVPTSGRVLELRYRRDGKTKRVLVGVHDADETARQIRVARARVETSRQRARVRIEAETEASAEGEPEEDLSEEPVSGKQRGRAR